jgi:phosphoribosylformylglycinamidine cyclo-ligase
VNHCINDIAVLGAEPLFFLDYIGTGKLEARVFTEIIKGFVRGCAENHCALIGGETAQMPGFYKPGEYDVSGTIVGVVERSRMLDGKSIRPGDIVIGLASSGLHTNGYSLARKILLSACASNHQPCCRPEALGEVLQVHVSCGPLAVFARKFNRPTSRQVIKGWPTLPAGFIDNLPRVLPANCDVRLKEVHGNASHLR